MKKIIYYFRRRMSNMNPESFVNFILAKEKTPSPSTRLMKEVCFSFLSMFDLWLGNQASLALQGQIDKIIVIKRDVYFIFDWLKLEYDN